MTTVVIIEAWPTPWDVEDRLVGNQSLPLTASAVAVIEAAVNQLDRSIDVVYGCMTNESIEQAAKIVATRFGLKPKHRAELDPVGLGLWQGLTRSDAKFRFPSAFEMWEENAAAVQPPDGESFDHAIERVRDALRKVLRRNRGRVIGLAVRSMTSQIILGLCRGESVETIAAHLHNHEGVTTIELSDEQFDRLLS